MYLHIQDVLLQSNIATKLPQPVWVDKNGVEVENEADVFGCKTSIHIDHPDMGIMFDEVGSNLSQEGDHANGGEKYVCGVDDEAYCASATKNTHFTTMGITSLHSQPLMCIILIAGKKRDVLVESGVVWQKLTTINEKDVDELDDYDFFKKYYGGDEVLPGGPVCMFKGKEVPAFIKFTDSGGIDGETLHEIFERIDSLEIYDEDRKNGLTHFALLDRHQSRFDLGFLRYINSPDTKWNVCIFVPYGTSIWQVGDSSEQNGTFKMSLNVEKKIIQ